MAFTLEEREQLGLRGLLPPRVLTIDTQMTRIMESLGRCATDLDRYLQLIWLLQRNETLFFRVLIDHITELMPYVYTPTVGEACQRFGHIFKTPRGLFISYEDRGKIRAMLDNWPQNDVRVIVVTDGERILGLGDLGASGAGIPIGKLLLYVACGGIEPERTLPVVLDVGTENLELLNDPLYPGLLRRRVRGAEYDAFVDEFVEAVRDKWGENCLIQWEDFANANAFRLLERWRDRHCSFNDDIQGTAAVALAGLLGALRMPRVTSNMAEHTFLFLGAGSAGIGIADLIVLYMVKNGQASSIDQARKRCWFIDSKGLVYHGRALVTNEKQRYAHEVPAATLAACGEAMVGSPHAVGNSPSVSVDADSPTQIPQRRIGLADAIQLLKPTALVGVSTIAKAFDANILSQMAANHERPIVFALSNPTSKSECTAREAYEFTQGRAIFASGSPFDPVRIRTQADAAEQLLVPGQANNVYCFPGCGFGIHLAGAKRFTDEMFIEAANAVASMVDEGDLRHGCVFPPMSKIRDVSARIAVAVANEAVRTGLATRQGSGSNGVFDLSDAYALQFDPIY
jgi:malate dehydrogenase (oxaloacetate-decarboxylating)(NADP+)